MGPILAPSWPYVGPMCWPMLAHLGAYVGAMLAISAAIYVERPPRCQFFRPGPLRGSQNHAKKKHGFLLSPRKKWDRPRPRNTVNSGVFVTSHARSTVNYSGVGRSVVGPGWVGGRGGQRISAGPVDGQSPRPKAASFSYSPYRRPMLRHRKTS